MIVPRYWSEAKTKRTVNGRQFTIKRFGWSDTSEQDAKLHADARLEEAVRTLEREGDVRRIDHKITYNGAEGIPIREEVISQHQDVVISRNSYGALCLNTPDVFFADIDFAMESSFKAVSLAFVLLLGCAAVVSFFFQSSLVFILGAFLALILSSTLAAAIRNLMLRAKGGIEKFALDRINTVATENPELHIRVYRTPMGFRVLLMNDTYSPVSDKTLALLQRFNSDSLYVRMCRNQQCFRARVSPKPWRIGVSRLTPRPGVWPIKAELLGERKKWVDAYEQVARNYSSCHYLCQIGSNRVHEKAEFVRKIHDDLCRATRTELAMA